MSDPCSCFRGEEVSPRRFEELEDGLVLPCGRVCDIDDDLGSRQCVGQTFSRDGVDPVEGEAATTSWPRWRRLLTTFVPMAAAANNDDFHFLVHMFGLSVWF